ncbi:MAG: SDR family NAD(P)-dependent oxidoreductase [Chloroflexi bacterium]|nr:SDR family NAD(P)-dependent oxidoreductase [Chloroflexota bacterium]
MSEVLKGRVAVVTGSGQGIGRAIAIEMAKEGAKVVTNNRKPGSSGGDAETTASDIRKVGGEAIAAFADVASFKGAESVIKAAVEKFGRVDILVNNAGADYPRMIWNMTEEDWDQCLNVVLKSAFCCTRFASAVMREQKYGRIINNTSSAWLGTVGHANYGAAKAGIVGFTRAVAREVGRYNMTCNAFAATAKTRMTVNADVEAGLKKRLAGGLITKERYNELLNPPESETVAPLVIYLAREDSGLINGQVLDVMGGKIAIYSEPVQMKSIYKEYGIWTQEELGDIIPKTLSMGLVNPAPPEISK